MDGWTWCTAKLHGQTCASGEGNAESSMTPEQQTPSLSGSSSMFWIGGKTPYSNALWWRELGPDSKPTHFNYDLYFYLEDASAPEALEFDVNQTISGTRYVFGTECSYHNTGHWQIWDSAGGKWFNTDVACPQVAAKQWHHLVWQFERIGNQAHYIGVTLDDQVHGGRQVLRSPEVRQRRYQCRLPTGRRPPADAVQGVARQSESD